MGTVCSTLKPITILIADHDRYAVEAIQSCFRSPNYLCTAVGKGHAVLDLLRESPFHLILCALRLPDSDGIEVLRQGLEIDPHAAFLMMGAQEEWGLAIQAMRTGAYDFLEKPVRSHSWIRSVQRALERRRRKTDQAVFHSLLEQTVQERTDHLHKALEQVEESHRSTLVTLMVALDAREHETQLHSLRVEAFTLLLADQCGYSSALRKELSQGALLHDIGKIVIPDSILLKPDRLTPEEHQLMRQHTVYGYEILSRIPYLKRAAMMALSHHERVDGEGYPLKLKGQDIPIEARIFAVADTLDVITAGRPYSPLRTLAEARAELVRCSGTQFDSDVVDVFQTISDEEWHSVREQVAQRFQSSPRPFSEILAAQPIPY